jgi:hypothetical protein
MTWQDVDIYFTVVAAIVGGVLAGWFAHGSARRGLFGLVLAVIISASFMFAPRAVSSFGMWRDIPQEVSLPQELWVDGMVPFPLAGVLAAIGCLFGFAQYKRCTE